MWWDVQGISECNAKDLHLVYTLDRVDCGNWLVVSREPGSADNDVMRLGIIEGKVIFGGPIWDSLELCFDGVCIGGWDNQVYVICVFE